MDAMKLVGLNTKWHRYQEGLTQEKFAERTKFKMAYISIIETGDANLTCKNIDTIAKSFGIETKQLFEEKTALKAKKLPTSVDKYIRQ